MCNVQLLMPLNDFETTQNISITFFWNKKSESLACVLISFVFLSSLNQEDSFVCFVGAITEKEGKANKFITVTYKTSETKNQNEQPSVSNEAEEQIGSRSFVSKFWIKFERCLCFYIRIKYVVQLLQFKSIIDSCGMIHKIRLALAVEWSLIFDYIYCIEMPKLEYHHWPMAMVTKANESQQ